MTLKCLLLVKDFGVIKIRSYPSIKLYFITYYQKKSRSALVVLNYTHLKMFITLYEMIYALIPNQNHGLCYIPLSRIQCS